jgi:hypothetical protein
MDGKSIGALFAAGMAAALAFVFWYQSRNPRVIVGYNQISVTKKSPAGVERATLRTREIEIAGRRFWEVELRNGTWIDCAGDCRKAVDEAGDGFWEKIERERGSR